MDFNSATTCNVLQGDFQVTDNKQIVFSTILGSCIATCLFDATAGVGGMNHFLLAGDASRTSSSSRYGINAMELLINGVLKLGAARHALQAKVFGGANMSANLPGIGDDNTSFVQQFLKDEGIPCISASVGGNQARRVRFHPASGRAQQILVARDQRLDIPKAPPAPPKPVPQEVILF